MFEILEHPRDRTFRQCVTFGKLDTRMKKLLYNLYNFLTCYGMPLLIMIFCYLKIFLTIAHHTNKNKTSNHKNQHRLLYSQNSIALKNFNQQSNLFRNNNLKRSQSFGKKPVNVSFVFSYLIIDFFVFKVEKKSNINDELLRTNTNNTYLKAKCRTLRLSFLIGKLRFWLFISNLN